MGIKTDGMNRRRAALVAVLFAWGWTQSALAAPDEKTREREALRRVQLAQQKLTQEKEQLETDKAGLEQKVARLSAQLDKLKKSEVQNDKDKSDLEAQIDALRRESDVLRTKVVDGQFREEDMEKNLEQLHGQLDETEKDRKRWELLATQKTQSFDVCEKKNMALYRINVELLQKYKNKGFREVMMLSEPFTQIKQVEDYNLIEEYKDKLESQRAKD